MKNLEIDLINATSVDEFIALIDKKESEKFPRRIKRSCRQK